MNTGVLLRVKPRRAPGFLSSKASPARTSREETVGGSEEEREAVRVMQTLHLRFRSSSASSLTLEKALSISIPPCKPRTRLPRAFASLHIGHSSSISPLRVRAYTLSRSNSDRLIPTLHPRPFIERTSAHVHPVGQSQLVTPYGELRGAKVRGCLELGVMFRPVKSAWLLRGERRPA